MNILTVGLQTTLMNEVVKHWGILFDPEFSPTYQLKFIVYGNLKNQALP